MPTYCNFRAFKLRHCILVLFAAFTLAGCQSAYYTAMEKVGVHKRDIVVDRVEDAKSAQQNAQQEFASALEAFTELTQFQGGELEAMYKKINGHYEDSASAVKQVRSRIESIEDVSIALFEEWQTELDLYSNVKLRNESERQLNATRRSYDSMLSAMNRAEQKMTPVLNTLRDHTLYLKHNLNARAIGALQTEFGSLENEIQRAISDMNAAIAESDKFLSTLK